MSLPKTIKQKNRLLVEGSKTHFDTERIIREQGKKYREFSPRHSKLAAAYMKGCQQFGIEEGGTILYLGASHGYTPSFVSDMIGKDGTLFCVEFAPTVCRDLVFVCEERENMIPILADANQPQNYTNRITAVDAVFQDIAQREQVEIFLKNFMMYCKPGGFGMLAIKARSIDVTLKPSDIFKDIRKRFENSKDFVIVDYRELGPFEKDHAFFVVKKR